MIAKPETHAHETSDSKTRFIAALNDAFRHCFNGGHTDIAFGLVALGSVELAPIVEKLRVLTIMRGDEC